MADRTHAQLALPADHQPALEPVPRQVRRNPRPPCRRAGPPSSWYGEVDWQINLRAIALGLEALRKLDRYGITSRGEQYTGWRAIEATPSSEFATWAEEIANV